MSSPRKRKTPPRSTTKSSSPKPSPPAATTLLNETEQHALMTMLYTSKVAAAYPSLTAKERGEITGALVEQTKRQLESVVFEADEGVDC